MAAVEIEATEEARRGRRSDGLPRWTAAGGVLLLAFGIQGCGGDTPVYGYKVVTTFPHDPGAFTQGLVYDDGKLHESTGREGESTVRTVDLATGTILVFNALSREHFGEGLALWQDRLIQLTWKSEKAFVYDREKLTRVATISYKGEGWGLTHDGTHLILSDGSAELRFLDPNTFEIVRRVTVKDGDRSVPRLNELEWIEGEVWANVWQTDRIARIDPSNGAVKSWVDLTGLLATAGPRPASVDVLNGIAYDPVGKRIFVTGKQWPKIFQIEVIPRP